MMTTVMSPRWRRRRSDITMTEEERRSRSLLPALSMTAAARAVATICTPPTMMFATLGFI